MPSPAPAGSSRTPAGRAFVAVVGHFATAERVYAGQPDPSDPSHFVIEIESGGRRHTVDGWLQDDDTPLLQLRSSAPITGRKNPQLRWSRAHALLRYAAEAVTFCVAWATSP